MKTINLFVKPKSKALWVRLEDLNWLCSYAADQHHFQGINRTGGVDSKTAVAERGAVVWNFGTRRWDVTLMDRSLSMADEEFMTDSIYRTVVEMYSIDNDKATARGQSARRRQASKRFLELWCEVAAAGKKNRNSNMNGAAASIEQQELTEALPTCCVDIRKGRNPKSRVNVQNRL